MNWLIVARCVLHAVSIRFAPSVCLLCVCVCLCMLGLYSAHVNATINEDQRNTDERKTKKKKHNNITQRRDDDGSADRLVMGYSGQAINLAHRTFYQPVNISPFVCIVAAATAAACITVEFSPLSDRPLQITNRFFGDFFCGDFVKIHFVWVRYVCVLVCACVCAN